MTTDKPPPPDDPEKAARSAAARMLARLRAEKLTPEERSAIGKKGAEARWGESKPRRPRKRK